MPLFKALHDGILRVCVCQLDYLQTAMPPCHGLVTALPGRSPPVAIHKEPFQATGFAIFT